MTAIDQVGLGLAILFITTAAFLVGYMIGHQNRKPTQVLMGVKQVDNRVMPDYSRAERRAHKKRSRG